MSTFRSWNKPSTYTSRITDKTFLKWQINWALVFFLFSPGYFGTEITSLSGQGHLYFFAKGNSFGKSWTSIGNFWRGTEAMTRDCRGHDLCSLCVIPGLLYFIQLLLHPAGINKASTGPSLMALLNTEFYPYSRCSPLTTEHFKTPSF